MPEIIMQGVRVAPSQTSPGQWDVRCKLMVNGRRKYIERTAVTVEKAINWILQHAASFDDRVEEDSPTG